jgi:hypothetical protein
VVFDATAPARMRAPIRNYPTVYFRLDHGVPIAETVPIASNKKSSVFGINSWKVCRGIDWLARPDQKGPLPNINFHPSE